MTNNIVFAKLDILTLHGGDIDMELWLLHVSTAAKYAHFDNTNVSQKLESKHEPFLADFKRGKTPQSQKGNTQRGFRSCWNFNKRYCSSYAAQPVPDPREAARRTLNMYFRYSWPLLGHFSSITPMNIIKADVHTCMLEIAAIFGCDCQLTTLYGKVAAKLRVSCELSGRL
jgi:hypothetical protein